jgi:hypothetical protein
METDTLEAIQAPASGIQPYRRFMARKFSAFC